MAVVSAKAGVRGNESGLDARHDAVRDRGREILAEADERRAATLQLTRETLDVLSVSNREGARAVDAIRTAVDLYVTSAARRPAPRI